MTEEITPTEGLAQATQAYAKAKSGEPASPAEPTPEAVPPEITPEPPPEPTPAPPEPGGEPPAPPAAAPPEPEPPATESPSDITDPAARRFLEMHGGDPNKAYAKAMEYNNRLAALAKEHPELFQPGAPADPRQVPEFDEPVLFEEPQPETPTLDYEVDQTAIRDTVQAKVFEDPHAVSFIQQFQANEQQRLAKDTEKTQLQRRINYLEDKSKDPDLAPDDLRRGEISTELDRLENKLSRIENEIYRIDSQNFQLNQQYVARREQIYEEIATQADQTAQEEAFTKYEQALEEQEFRKTMVEWPSALDRVIKENEIPQELVEDFKADARREFQAAMADPEMVIEDMYAFLAPKGKDIKARLDRYHRVQSGRYATQVQTRAQTPSPPTTPGTPAPPPAPEETDLDAIMADRRRVWKQATRG